MAQAPDLIMYIFMYIEHAYTHVEKVTLCYTRFC